MTLEAIRAEIKKLQRDNPHIHMNVTLQRPKLLLENAEATIVGAYPHIFTIEETTSGSRKCHSLQYTDILTGNIKILEMKEL